MSEETPEQASESGRPIAQALRRFWAAVDAIRHLDEHLTPRANALDEDRLSPAALTAVASLSADRQARLKAWFEGQTASGLEIAVTTDGASAIPPPAPPDSGAEPADPPTAEKEAHERAAELNDILGNRAVAIEFAHHLAHLISAPLRANLLRRSLLVTAFGAFEVLVGSVARL